MRALFFLALGVITLAAPVSALGDEGPKTYPLWPEGAPGALGSDPGDDNDPGDVPTITVYLPTKDKANGASVVICPGGGYSRLAINHEGHEIAQWLNDLGVAGIILKYRVGPRYQHPIVLGDAQRAIRTVRARASEWGLDPGRVAILGFSAGGHLASTVATQFDQGQKDAEDPIDRQSCRPDLAILAYPVISFRESFGHTRSRQNLLGENPSQKLVDQLSSETQVTRETPPTFLVHTNEDSGVPAENSIQFVLALRKSDVPVEFHLFERGRHGLGLGKGSAGRSTPSEQAFRAWPALCETWLKNHGFLDRPD